MGKVKAYAQDKIDHAKPLLLRRRKKKINRKEHGEPMSINRPFDNAAAWLADEPWRTW